MDRSRRVSLESFERVLILNDRVIDISTQLYFYEQFLSPQGQIRLSALKESLVAAKRCLRPFLRTAACREFPNTRHWIHCLDFRIRGSCKRAAEIEERYKAMIA